MSGKTNHECKTCRMDIGVKQQELKKASAEVDAAFEEYLSASGERAKVAMEVIQGNADLKGGEDSLLKAVKNSEQHLEKLNKLKKQEKQLREQLWSLIKQGERDGLSPTCSISHYKGFRFWLGQELQQITSHFSVEHLGNGQSLPCLRICICFADAQCPMQIQTYSLHAYSGLWRVCS